MLDHYRQFINWHFVPDPGKKPKKVPFDPVTGFAIDPHDPKHWRSREQCATTGHPVGFVLTLRDPLWFFDLDDCKQADGKWTPEAEAVFMSFPGAAGEVSISGNGLHIMGVGDQLRLSDRKHKWISPGGLHCEFYTTGRFIALGRGFQGNFNLDWTERLLQIVPQKPAVDTSAVFGNGPVPEYTGTADDGELIRKMMASRGSIGVQFGTKASFKDLWTGDAANLSQLFKSPSDDVYDRSAADASLMVQLAYWTGKDVARMDRLFRLSALFRPKYATRADYRESTIRSAIGVCKKVYDVVKAVEEPTILTEHLNEDVLADAFSKKYADNLRYVADWGSWLVWDGTRWKKENTHKVFDLVRAFCRASVQSMDISVAKAAKLVSAATVAAVEKFARADRRHASTADQWDKNQWLLNTPTAVVDLKTGRTSPHDPDFHMMKVTAVGPADNSVCPRWMQFLDQTFPGDRDLVSYIRRVIGYSLTGSVQEHAIFFGYGRGGNGKSVFLNTVTRFLGDYSVASPMDTFSASKNERHPTELARLQGARFVSSQETEEGRAWAENRLKMLSGGDRVTARFMHANYFEFDPHFKLFFAGNHKPTLRNVDDAMRRRFHLIPFTAEIPVEQRDANLEEKLRDEWPGILRWAIDGCLDWQKMGLAPPKAVQEATNEYFETEDTMGQWLDECCQKNSQAWASSSALYNNYKSWAERSREFVFKQKRFSQSLIERGFSKKDTRDGKGFIGLELKTVLMPGMIFRHPSQT